MPPFEIHEDRVQHLLETSRDLVRASRIDIDEMNECVEQTVRAIQSSFATLARSNCNLDESGSILHLSSPGNGSGL